MSTKNLFWRRQDASPVPYVAAALVCITLTSCGGGSGDADVQQPEDVVGQAPVAADDVDDIDVLGTIEDDPVSDGGEGGLPGTSGPSGSPAETVGLVVDSTQRCAIVFEPLQVVVTRNLEEGEVPDTAGELPNVTSSVRFDQRFGSSLNLVSVNGDSASFEMSAQDIVGLSASVENGSVTVFIAGYDSELPASFIMRKPVPNGCLYAFKSGDFCTTGASRPGNLLFNRNGASMSAVGCELENPNSLPVIELTP